MISGGGSDSPCIFCSIGANRATARVVWRNETAVAFLPDNPAVLGHTLVVPIRHVADFWELNHELASELFVATRAVAAAVSEARGTRDLNLIQSSGEVAGQSVFHLHIHIVPRTPGDRMPELWPPDLAWTAETLDEVADKIRLATRWSNRSD